MDPFLAELAIIYSKQMQEIVGETIQKKDPAGAEEESRELIKKIITVIRTHRKEKKDKRPKCPDVQRRGMTA